MARREGLKAVDLFQAVEDGKIKALWIMATNPAASLPRADAVRAALAALDLLVVSDNVLGADTVSLAKVRLPACGWGEKDGTITNSERRISRQRMFLPPPGEASPTGGSSPKSRAEWDMWRLSLIDSAAESSASMRHSPRSKRRRPRLRPRRPRGTDR